MKTKRFIVLIFCLIGTVLYSQTINRVEIRGKVVVDWNELEGITVYNASSNKGTVTDKEGVFELEVAINDRVQFAALQFQNFEVVITQDVMESKFLTVFLVEQVNKLDEVIILPHDLTGNIAIDLKSVELVNPDLDAVYFGLDNLDKMEFFDGYSTRVDNMALQSGVLKYQADFVKLLSTIIKPFVKSNTRRRNKKQIPNRTILGLYSKVYLKGVLSIPESDIVEFVFFVEEDNFDLKLLNPKREFEFLEFLKSQEEKFVLVKYGKK